jgi:hypothetical protein
MVLFHFVRKPYTHDNLKSFLPRLHDSFATVKRQPCTLTSPTTSPSIAAPRSFGDGVMIDAVCVSVEKRNGAGRSCAHGRGWWILIDDRPHLYVFRFSAFPPDDLQLLALTAGIVRRPTCTRSLSVFLVVAAFFTYVVLVGRQIVHASIYTQFVYTSSKRSETSTTISTASKIPNQFSSKHASHQATVGVPIDRRISSVRSQMKCAISSCRVEQIIMSINTQTHTHQPNQKKDGNLRLSAQEPRSLPVPSPL